MVIPSIEVEVKTRNGIFVVIAIAVSVFLASCSTTPSVETEPEPVKATEPADVEPSTSGIPTLEEAEEVVLDTKSAEVEERVKVARSIASQIERLGAEVSHVDGSTQWIARKDKRTLTLEEGSRLANLDGVNVYLDQPLSRKKGRWLLSETDEELILKSTFSELRKTKTRTIKTIVIDPGHGGSENGTTNANLGLLEKDLNLDVSERLKKHLEELGYGVVFTRYDDRVVSLEERPAIANQSKADLFVSIHFNAAASDKPTGLETYMLTPAGQPSTSGNKVEDDAIRYSGNAFDIENFELAYRIQNSILGQLQRADRGVKKARFKVLKTLDCPGVLVECGFVSNGDEALLISTAAYRERLALALADAIDAYAKNTPMGAN